MSVLLADPSGGFQTRTDHSVGTEPRSVALGDFSRNGLEGDGKLDLVTVNYGSDNVSVLRDR